jgi:hypothetical protein
LAKRSTMPRARSPFPPRKLRKHDHLRATGAHAGRCIVADFSLSPTALARTAPSEPGAPISESGRTSHQNDANG